MHRLLCPGDRIDHKNTNKLDNRRSNLRPADRSQNAANTPLTRSNVGVKGVRAKDGKFEASLRGVYLGRFDTVEAAAEAYRRAADVAYGEFANHGTAPDVPTASPRPPAARRSHCRGVYWRKGSNKWQGLLTANGRKKYLGLFETELAAAVAYNIAALSEIGPDARINDVFSGEVA